jgi:hypothetical protein
MEKIYTKALALRRLKTVIESGVFAVPELQREFVWSARKTCDLLDSIYYNYPIGTILVWKTDRRNEGQLRKQLHILPPFSTANPHIYFLIDGQQRLSVLWHFLRGEATSVDNAEGKQVHFGRVYFNPYAQEGDHPFLYRRRLIGDLAGKLIPVVDLLSVGWRRRVRGHGTRAMRRIKDCRQRILAYKAILVFCETKDLVEVRESFIRINSLGMQIGVADRAFARASKFRMRAMVREAQERLRHGFARVRRTTILQTMALALGARDLGERAIDAMISNLEKKESERTRFDRMWPTLREAFAIAVDFMVYEFGVANLGFLPSEPMLEILTLFFFYNDNARPSQAAKVRLRRWFWATALGARYTGRGYRPNLLADAAFVKRLADNPNAQAGASVKVPIQVLRDTEYRRPGPVSNGFFCLLRLTRPRYLEDGAEIPLGDVSSRRNRRDKHHIFPRALLKKHGIGERRANSLLNICYLVARENQSVSKRAPRDYLDDLPRSNRARQAAMRSHLISGNPRSGVWDRSVKRGFKFFLDDRARLLVKAFEERAEMRLFERE